MALGQKWSRAYHFSGLLRLKAYQEIKGKSTQVLGITLACFEKVFQVENDACGIGIGGVHTQEGWPLAVFSKTLCDSKRIYSTYDK